MRVLGQCYSVLLWGGGVRPGVTVLHWDGVVRPGVSVLH